jgi:hypothetical protein
MLPAVQSSLVRAVADSDIILAAVAAAMVAEAATAEANGRAAIH